MALDAGGTPAAVDAGERSVGHTTDAGVAPANTGTARAERRTAMGRAGSNRSGLSAPIALRPRGIERRQKKQAKIVVDADAANVVVFAYEIDHRP
jgi:hypothetical protein